MSRILKKIDNNRGLTPGSLVFIGNQKEESTRIRLIDYDNDQLREHELKEIAGSKKFVFADSVTWLNIDGLHDTELMKEIKESFGLHSLLVEDVLNTGQRPKYEEYENHALIVLKMFLFNNENQLVESEQLSIVLGSKYLITFQERRGDVFEPLRERIRKQKGRIRAAGIDYLAYALLDIIVDNYIFLIEKIGEQIEDLENEILSDSDESVMEKINTFKREINFLRKSVRPVREIIMKMLKSENNLFHKDTIPFLRDLEDHITMAVEAIDSYKDMLSDHFNLYTSTIGNKMNEIMKVLTIFASIFIPLTFIAGIYGTNFDYLPELHFKYSYFVLWGIMVTIGVVMLLFFRKKKWL